MLIKINNYKINAKVCKSFISKAVGLMFSFRPRNLLFVFKKEKISSLHMLFVFFPIDAVFLDRNKKIVEIKKNFRSFTFYMSRKKAKYILEMEKGSVKKYGVKVGMRVDF